MSLRTARSAIVCLVNRERRARGLRGLRTARSLQTAALNHSYDMRRRGYFAHQRSGGPALRTRVRRTGYPSGSRSWRAQENLAMGSRRLGTPRRLVRAWMNSSSHRRTLLDPGLRHIGPGLVWGRPGSKSSRYSMVTLDFGRR
ncbi:MAG: CAP domain-containing protein [Solirubrobacterales bacterium]